MPGPHPVALRERAVRAYFDSGESLPVVAEQFSVGEATLKRWVWRHERQGGDLTPDRPGGGRPLKLGEEHRDWLRERVAERPTTTIPELTYELGVHFKLEVSHATVGRALARLGYSRKRGSGVRSRRTRSG